MSYKSSKNSGGEYYLDCQSKTVDDYYANNNEEAKEPPGEWFCAQGSAAFGIQDGSKFSDDAALKFRSLVNGFDPETGEAITQNSGKADRTALHDFCFSSPKSVGVVWSQANSDVKFRITEAQRLAVREALNFMSAKAGFTRRGKAGTIKEHVGLCGAIFEHGSSRENDPNLHTHGVILNAAMREDGTMGSIETKDLFQWIGASASIYHASLSSRLHSIGFEIEREGKLFEIAGVPEKVRDHFSRRREQIVQEAKQLARERGTNVSAILASQGLMQVMAVETRADKGELTRSELQYQWTERGQAIGFTNENVLALIDSQRHKDLTHKEREILVQGVDEELTSTQSTFSEPALYTAIAVRLMGRGGIDDIDKAIAQVKERLLVTEVLNGQLVFTTAEMRLIEERMVELAGVKDLSHVMPHDSVEDAISRRPTMTEEQAGAVRHALFDEKRVSVVQGSAGSGKTFSLKTVAEVYKEQGYDLHAIAAPWSAADNLKKEAGLDTHRAIAGWLKDIDRGTIVLNKKSVVVVDEAGMVSVRDMARILEAAEQGGSKVILTGDQKQLNSLQAGDALRTITERYGCARIDKIQRQKNPDGSIKTAHVEAIKDLFDGKASKAMVALKNNIHLGNGADEVNQMMFSAWAKSKFENGDQSHLMIAKRNCDVSALNAWAHEHLKSTGAIDSTESISIRSIDSDKSRPLVEFCKGDEVQFRNNQHDLEIYNRTRATIQSINGATIFLKTSEGKEIKMDTRDSLWRMHGTKDLALQHAYAVTCFGSQGLTVDRTFVRDSVNMDTRTAGVSLSRHRFEVDVFADKAEHYTRMMERADKQDWKPKDQVSDREILDHIQKGWEQSPNKSSTLDYEREGMRGWYTHVGDKFHAKSELELKILKDTGIDISKEKSMSKGEPNLPFQRLPGYSIESRLSDAKESVAMQLRADLVRDGVSPAVLLRAEHQGVLRWGQEQDGKMVEAPTFVGRDESGRAVNAVTESTYKDPFAADGALRHRYLPILQGDTDDVHIVASGREGMQLWSQFDRDKKPLPTVLISGIRPDSLRHEQTQKILANASKVIVHEEPEKRFSAEQHQSIQVNVQKENLQVIQPVKVPAQKFPDHEQQKKQEQVLTR